MKKYCFGIDIGGTTVKCGLFNVDGEVLDKWEIKTRTENNGENIIADIAETMNAKIAEKGLDKEEIVGAGVGVPGPADEEGNVPVASICTGDLYHFPKSFPKRQVLRYASETMQTWQHSAKCGKAEQSAITMLLW